MNISTATWQEFVFQFRVFLQNVGPAAIVTIILLFVFWVGRFTGKYTEQRNILRHMPEIIHKEVNTRNARIQELEAALTQVQDRYDKLLTMARAAQRFARKIDQTILYGLERQVRTLIEGS